MMNFQVFGKLKINSARFTPPGDRKTWCEAFAFKVMQLACLQCKTRCIYINPEEWKFPRGMYNQSLCEQAATFGKK
jgi:hypothetical protein